MKRRTFLASMAAAGMAAAGMGRAGAADAAPSWRALPRWRGFNLLEKFYRNERFREQDFQWISDWGFDFVRLPMDYQQWTDANDPQNLDEAVLEHVDEAVELGERYGVHVSLNLHNAPGYTVNSAIEHELNLWEDAEAQEQFAYQWKTLARRYRGIPREQVSFNLVNEPANVDEETYLNAVMGAIEAIREADSGHLIITDALGWGRDPVEAAGELQLAQSTRGYSPMELTHYRASWVSGADTYPTPAWPALQLNGRLFGPQRPDWTEPIVIEGGFDEPTQLRVRVRQVSNRSRLVIRANGETILDHTFEPDSGEGEWEEVVYADEWDIYQNMYNRDYRADIPAGTERIELRNEEGDWMTLSELGLRPAGNGGEHVLTLPTQDFGQPGERVVQYDPSESGRPFTGPDMMDREWLAQNFEPWKALAQSGTGVHVGEWGAHRYTPHDVVLRWAEDQLAVWQDAGVGWALWNLRGSFGIIDSNREDVDYEEFHGHQLDRAFLELLRRY